MNEIKIEKNVPIPAKRGGGPKSKYRWEEMKVGDSFFASVNDIKPAAMGRTMVAAGLRHGMTFSRRRVVENGVRGTRVWRLS